MEKDSPANAGDIRGVVQFLGQEDHLEEEMATCSGILAWKIPWTEEPGGLQPMGPQTVGHNWATKNTINQVNLTHLSMWYEKGEIRYMKGNIQNKHIPNSWSW